MLRYFSTDPFYNPHSAAAGSGRIDPTSQATMLNDMLMGVSQ